MSQGAGFNEPDLLEGIYRSINIKIDRESLVKPSRELMMEIYSRFLDLYSPRWSEFDDEKEIQIFRVMLQLLRADKTLDIEFTIDDINHPTRRRTAIFLASLINHRDRYDDWLNRKESDLATTSAKQERLNHLKKENLQMRQKIDELAYQVGQVDTETAFPRFEELKLILKEKQRRNDELDEEVKEIKGQLTQTKEKLQQKVQRERKIEEEYLRLKSANSLARQKTELEEARFKLEKDLENLKLQKSNSVKLAQNEFEKKKQDLMNAIQSRTKRNMEVKDSIAELVKRRSDISNERKKCSEMVDKLIEKERKHLETFKLKHDEDKQEVDEAYAIIASYNSKIRRLVRGETKPITEVPVPLQNNTYIKSSSMIQHR